MRVVVNHGDAVHLAHKIESAADTREGRQRSGSLLWIQPEHVCESHCGCRVAHHVQSGNASPTVDGLARRKMHHERPDRDRPGRPPDSERHSAHRSRMSRHGGRYLRRSHQTGVVAAHNQRSAVDGTPHEMGEGAFDLLKRVVVIEMVRLDVGDHRNERAQVHKRTVALVGLDHVVLAVSAYSVRVEPSISPPMRNVGSRPIRDSIVAIIDEVEVLPCVPATAIVSPLLGKMSEHPGARPHLKSAGTCLPESGFLSGMAEETTTTCGITQVLGCVTDGHRYACALERARVARLLQVAAGDPHSPFGQYQRDAAHAGTACTNEVA